MAQQISTRQTILELLKKHKQLSVSELKKDMDITEMAIRKHLIKLEGEQLVNTITVRQPMGRPVIFYGLSEKGESLFPTSYNMITMEFLKDIEEINGPETIELLFEKRQKRMQKKLLRRIDDEDSMEQKVKDLIQVQKENGYMAEVNEISESEMVFSQYNCPIAEIAQKYNKPCSCELNLYKEVLGTDTIDRVSCIADGETSCKYVLKLKEEQKETVSS